MPRQVRIQYRGAMYHVMSRGNRRQEIYLDDKALRRGWWLGSEEFKEQKLEDLNGQVGQHHFGQMRLEVAQAKAERIITEELRHLGWQERQLASRRKRDPCKLAIGVRLRKETTLSVKQIAARLPFSHARQRQRLPAGGAEENNRLHANPRLPWNLRKRCKVEA
jgi:hypothetical protein